MSRPTVAGSTFVIASHGTEDEPPASGVWQFLMARGAQRVDLVFHPLAPEDGDRHRHTVLSAGRPGRRRTRALPTRVPYTFPLDALWPPRLPHADAWLCFDNLLAGRALVERAAGRTDRVVLWSVDFVPDRFGAGTPLTRAYDALDAFCCRRVDHRIELSSAARDGRDARHGLTPQTSAPVTISPVGAWLDRAPKVPQDGCTARRVVFIGHLVPRMGLALGIDAIARLAAEGVDIHLDVAGHGPEREALEAQAELAGIADRVTFHGFISEHERLEALLAGASVALAPYAPDPDSFTRFADPSKLKAYLAAGIPILLTDVPPNAAELAAEAGAQVVPYDAGAWAAAIDATLGDAERWAMRRAQALTYVRRFDWDTILSATFTDLGFEV